MPRTRQAGPIPAEAIAIRSLALGLGGGQRIDAHTHPWAQLIYGASGVMTVETDQGTWVVPSRRAVWVPGDVDHEIETTGPVAMRTLYVRPDLARRLSAACCVVHVSPLLRELVLHIVSIGYLEETRPDHEHLIHVLLDLLVETEEAPLVLPLPTDPRARRVAERLRADPANGEAATELAHRSGASARTIERIFRRETGLSFGRWRQQARLLFALRRLADGDSVTTVALDAGYESPSAFIAMFKRAMGVTPGRYYDGQA